MSDDETKAIPEVPAEETAPADEPTIRLPEVEDPTIELPAPAEPAAPATSAEPVLEPPSAATPSVPLGVPADTGHIRVTSAPVPQPAPSPPPRPTLRVGTVVWGLVIAAVGVGLLSIAWGAQLDAQLALIVLLGAAGVALLVGSLVAMRRSRSRMEGRG